jgi:hypothetical protein
VLPKVELSVAFPVVFALGFAVGYGVRELGKLAIWQTVATIAIGANVRDDRLKFLKQASRCKRSKNMT